MTPDERKLLDEVAVLAQENNRILRKIQRGRRWSLVYNLVKWAAIIVLAVAGYYYLEPYLNPLRSIFSTLWSGFEDVKRAGGLLPGLEEILQGLKNILPGSNPPR